MYIVQCTMYIQILLEACRENNFTNNQQRFAYYYSEKYDFQVLLTITL